MEDINNERMNRLERYCEKLVSLSQDDTTNMPTGPHSVQRSFGFEPKEEDPPLADIDKPFIQKTLDETVVKLAKSMDCPKDRILLNAFSNPESPNLAYHLLYIPQLGLPANLSNNIETDSTVFIEACKKIIVGDFPNAKDTLLRLYKHNVMLNDQDTRYMEALYKEVLGKPREEVDWIKLRTFMKIDTYEDLIIAFENLNIHTICIITGIITDSIFGKNHNSMAAFINYSLKAYKENSLLIIKACDIYKPNNKFLQEATTNKKFKELRDNILAGNEPQNEDYGRVLLSIFPKLA